jgi:hypothetical protein
VVATFVDETAQDAATFTFSGLDRATDDQAHFPARSCGPAPGDRALLVLTGV